jgi:hypothetical protein
MDVVEERNGIACVGRRDHPRANRVGFWVDVVVLIGSGMVVMARSMNHRPSHRRSCCRVGGSALPDPFWMPRKMNQIRISLGRIWTRAKANSTKKKKKISAPVFYIGEHIGVF